MTYKEAYKIVEAALLENAGWFPENTYEALDVLEELVKAHTEKASYEELAARAARLIEAFGSVVPHRQTVDENGDPTPCSDKPPELQSGVAIQEALGYDFASLVYPVIPIDPDIDARVEEMARKAKKSG